MIDPLSCFIIATMAAWLVMACATWVFDMWLLGTDNLRYLFFMFIGCCLVWPLILISSMRILDDWRKRGLL